MSKDNKGNLPRLPQELITAISNGGARSEEEHDAAMEPNRSTMFGALGAFTNAITLGAAGTIAQKQFASHYITKPFKITGADANEIIDTIGSLEGERFEHLRREVNEARPEALEHLFNKNPSKVKEFIAMEPAERGTVIANATIETQGRGSSHTRKMMSTREAPAGGGRSY